MRIFWFTIPAHGHTNPTIEVVRELVRQGHEVRYYSFGPFREKIESCGAAFVDCDAYLPPLDERGERRMRKSATTEMSVRSFETTALLDPKVAADVASLSCDLIVSDSACFWGKLFAQKYGLPLVTSTTTFAFNRHSARYMQSSASELSDMILGLPRMNHALKKLRPLGYHVKSALDLVESKEGDDTIVYTSRRFQPCSETFDATHYRFVGPSIRPVTPKDKAGARMLVYASLGTVINDHPDFYRSCIDALSGTDVDLIISCGEAFDRDELGMLPANAVVENTVDQLEVLSRTSLFITHCGMNSTSEALYLGVPLLLFPLTSEQRAVARRVEELGAGSRLTEDVAKRPDALREAICRALRDECLAAGAARMRDDLTACPGAAGAADFIEEVVQRRA